MVASRQRMPRRLLSIAAVASAVARPARATAGAGLPGCLCIEDPLTDSRTSGLSDYVKGGSLIYAPAGSAETYVLPFSYGDGCLAHDDGNKPHCASSRKPAWCLAEWCYVDPNSCPDGGHVKSKYFGNVPSLYFSFATCRGAGASSSPPQQNEWTAKDRELTRRLVGLATSYSSGVRDAMESTRQKFSGASGAVALAPLRNMEQCSDCTQLQGWGRVDFSRVGMLEGPGAAQGSEAMRSEAVAISRAVATNYKAIAALNSPSKDHENIGFLYSADQATAGYTQWPMTDASSWGTTEEPFDPRFRPWYAAGATGPKDVIIVVDVSQSMHEAGRDKLAQAATLQVLDTLSWKDFATIILFNHGASAVYSEVLVPVTDTERARMRQWCKDQTWKLGGTNFRVALEKAASVIENSVRAKKTSMCQKAVMFLTDGTAEFTDADFARFRQAAQKNDIVVFSYALGSGANLEIPRKLACQNKGLFYAVPDNADLRKLMSGYYDYFAAGMEICSPTYVKYVSTDSQTLYGACVPAYARNESSRSLLGVSCTDINMLGDISALKAQAGWQHFKCQASDRTKMCQSLDLSDCHLQEIRRRYSPDSVCEDQAFSSGGQACPCQHNSCQDDQEFRDSKHYFCDTWVGDDCNNPKPEWGYTDADMAIIRTKCQRSCGLCPWIADCSQMKVEECHQTGVQEECRACLGVTSGTDIDGHPMRCPADAPRNIMSTTTSRGAANSAVSLAPPCLWAVTSLLAATSTWAR